MGAGVAMCPRRFGTICTSLNSKPCYFGVHKSDKVADIASRMSFLGQWE